MRRAMAPMPALAAAPIIDLVSGCNGMGRTGDTRRNGGLKGREENATSKSASKGNQNPCWRYLE